MDIIQYNLNITELNYIIKLGTYANKGMSCRNIREHTQDFGGMVAESMWQFIFQVKREYF